jgi:hypothetical protein
LDIFYCVPKPFLELWNTPGVTRYRVLTKPKSLSQCTVGLDDGLSDMQERPISDEVYISTLRAEYLAALAYVHTCTFGLFKVWKKNLRLGSNEYSVRIKMKKVLLFASSIGILPTILGCSGDAQTLRSTVAVVQASTAPANTTPATESAAALPVPSVGKANQQAWHSENVRDRLGNAVAVKGTSLDGQFDLVILQRGKYSFLSVVRHERWESVHDQLGKGRLMYLRVKFEDGQEKRIEWDELGFATENLCSVLWSYPIKTDAPIGPVLKGPTGDSVGGDQLLIQDMMKHKTMLLEVEPGMTAQFDMTGLAHELDKARSPQNEAGY